MVLAGLAAGLGFLFYECLVVLAGLAYVLEGCFGWVVKTRHSPVRSKRNHAEKNHKTPFAYRVFSAPCLDKLISELS